MKRTIKLVFCIVLVTAFITTSLGTASAVATNTKSKNDLYTIKFFHWLTKAKNSNETDIGKVIKNKFNIEFEYMAQGDNSAEKSNLMLASGDYPELIMGDSIALKKYVDANALVSLDQYLPGSKYFKNTFKEQIPYWRLLSDDGKLYKWEYGVPTVVPASWAIFDIAVRTDALEKQGWPNLVTQDDWVAFLKKAMKDFPEVNGKKTFGMSVPFGESWGVQGISANMYEKGKYIPVGNEAVIWSPTEKKFVDYFLNEYSLVGWKFFNRLYREGILDRECFTDKCNNVQEKMNSGRALSVWYFAWSKDSANAELVKAKHPEMQYIMMPIMAKEQIQRGDKRQIRVDFVQQQYGIAITKNAKDPKRIFDLVDWACSDEAQRLLQSGIEGKQYTIKNGVRVPTAEYLKMYGDEQYQKNLGTGYFVMLPSLGINAKDGKPYSLLNDLETRDKLFLNDRVKEAYSKLGWKNSLDFWLKNSVECPNGIHNSIQVDPASDIGTQVQKLTEFRVKISTKLMLAKTEAEFNKIWDNAVQDYKKMNPQKVVDEYNRLYSQAASKINALKNK